MAKASKKPVGGQRIFDRDKVVDLVCARLSKGEPLATICRSNGMPGLKTIYDWMGVDEGISTRIARAREEGEEAIAAGCMDIADETPPTTMNGSTDAGYVQHQKLRIWTRLELLKRWNPKKWADRQAIDHTSSDGSMAPVGRIEIEVIGANTPPATD